MENQVTIWQKTSEKASKVELIRIFSHLTPEKIIDAKFPSLADYKRSERNKIAATKKNYFLNTESRLKWLKQFDEKASERVERLIKMLVLDLSSSFDNCIKEPQAEEIAVEIMSSHITRSMSPEDIYYALRQLKINNTHGNITVNKILKAINEHNALRMEIVTKKSQGIHLGAKQPTIEEQSRSSETYENKVKLEQMNRKIITDPSIKSLKRNLKKRNK